MMVWILIMTEGRIYIGGGSRPYPPIRQEKISHGHRKNTKTQDASLCESISGQT